MEEEENIEEKARVMEDEEQLRCEREREEQKDEIARLLQNIRVKRSKRPSSGECEWGSRHGS